MKVLITGGAGFIGSHLAEALVKDGHDVHIIDNLETGSQENISSCQLTYNHIDISHPLLIDVVFDYVKPDVVVHAAASYKDPSDWARDAITNVVGTANVCSVCKKHDVKRLIYFQTSLCYGVNPGIYRIPGDELKPVLISQPINPAPNSYAITKTAAEQLIAMSGVPFISFRLANCYGPRNLTGPVPAFYKNLKTGRCSSIAVTRRDFLYVGDLIKLVKRAVNGEGTDHYYHVSTGTDYEIRELHELMVEIMDAEKLFPGFSPMGRMMPPNPGDAYTILLDPSKTQEHFPGWIADTFLYDGLKEAIEWYDTHGVTQTYTHLKQD